LIAIVAGTAAVTTAMYGDGAELQGHARGGDDTLFSATSGNDQMWGGAAVVAPPARTGAGTFRVSPPHGHHHIMDFEPGSDHVQLNGFAFTGFADLANDIQYSAAGALITFDASDSILLAGISHLSASDFVLA